MDDEATFDVGPRKITARVAPFLVAIKAARKNGWSWADIALRVAPGASGDAVRIAVRMCRYTEVEQRPLPVLAAAEPQQRITKKAVNPAMAAKANPVTVVDASAPAQRRPLPGQIPVGDGDAMQAALAAKGIVFK
jgi:hypothetical protein